MKGVAGLQSGGLGGEKEGSMVAPESVVGLGEAGGGCEDVLAGTGHCFKDESQVRQRV